jgi:hypothetical protein
VYSTNKEASRTKYVIAFPSNRLQLGEFVEAIASGGGVTTSQSPSLDESPPPFIDVASRHTNQLLPESLNEGIKDAVLILEGYLASRSSPPKGRWVHLQDCNCE